MALPWKEEYKLGVASIDVQHQKLIGIINALSDNLARGMSRGDIDKAIVRMGEYVVEHFSYEEECFKKCAYKETPAHVHEHELFTTKTKEFQERAKTEDPSLSIELLGFLEGWFLHHVLVVDRRYAETFHACGIE